MGGLLVAIEASLLATFGVFSFPGSKNTLKLTSCMATPRATGERIAKTLSLESRSPAWSRSDGAVS